MLSPKMYKNKIKDWGITKYLKADVAERLAKSKSSPDADRAQRSMMRRKARLSTSSKKPNEKPIENPQPLLAKPTTTLSVVPPGTTSITGDPMSSSYTESPIKTEMKTPWEPPPNVRRDTIDINGVNDQFILNFRRWTHEAYISGKFERSNSTEHEKGRHVSREFASDLQAGLNYQKQGKTELAWVHWRAANRRFENPDLFSTWYHETPIRLLFELARIQTSGYPEYAESLLRQIEGWAITRLPQSDIRRALYSTYGQIEVSQLKELYEQAAKCMLSGMTTRLEKDDPLLFEVRLNRALDMSWFDPSLDLTQWLPPLEEADQAMGPENAFSIYYLLLQAYLLVARGDHSAVDKTTAEARRRIEALPRGNVDQEYKLGMAYRRLGRIQHERKLMSDAKRSFNHAWKYLKDGKHADGLMVEVLHCQLDLARQTDDIFDVELVEEKLAALEKKNKEREAKEMQKDLASLGGAHIPGLNGYVGPIPSINILPDGGKSRSPSPIGPGKLSRMSTL